jgi:hypothetical protein
MLLTGWDDLCGPLPALFQAAAYHPPAVSPSAFSAFVYWKFLWRSAPCPSPLLLCIFSNSTHLLCVTFQFLVFCSLFFPWKGRRSVCPGAMLVYPRGGWGNTTWPLVFTCLVCWISPKQVWSQHLATQQPSSFLIVMWHGEAFHGPGVQNVEVLILLAALFPPSVAPASQRGFGVTELTLSASVP